MYIWKRAYHPFVLGGTPYCKIKTEVFGFPVIELGKGFKGIYIEKKGTSGVYSLNLMA